MANMRSQLESGLHLLRDEYRSVEKIDDAVAVTELMQKLKKVAKCANGQGIGRTPVHAQFAPRWARCPSSAQCKGGGQRPWDIKCEIINNNI
jgi:hypothetical protein